MDASPSSAASGILTLNEVVTRMHVAYMTLPEELCPVSQPPSPTSEERVAATKEHITDLVNLASGETTNPKWAHVTRAVSMSCTSRKYDGVAAGVRVGDGRKVSVGKSFKWELPDTEEEWDACAQIWKVAVAEEERRTRIKSKTASTASKTSKYWQKPADQTSEVPPRPNSKTEVIREKIARWQAEVVTVPAAEDVPISPETVDSSQPAKVVKGKAKAQSSAGEKVQVSLRFPVVKRSSVTSAKGGSASSKSRLSPAAPRPASPIHAVVPSTDKNQLPTSSNTSGPSKVPVIAHIAEVPENSFLPPSFPSQLQTSTPLFKDRRHKPYPIAPCSPPPSSPLSSTSFDISRPRRRNAQRMSSSQLDVSPMHKQSKRLHSPNQTPDNVRMDVSPQPSHSVRPATKRARVELLPQTTEQEPVSSGSIPVSPSTPPPTSPSLAAPVTPVSRGKGLGNAKGLPVPTTPNSLPLPTLTDLLASSRRSKPRPRPPSRKNTPQSRAGMKGRDKYSEQVIVTELPALAEHGHESEGEGEGEAEAEASPAKTYFSSPASGSSDSPMSIAHRPTSPMSPLFTQHPSAFVPRFTSTQRAGVASGEDPFLDNSLQPHGGLMRGSSGFFGMGYSSQFDVEGHVEQVSELLERDVDFNGWLRDMGTDGDIDD